MHWCMILAAALMGAGELHADPPGDVAAAPVRTAGEQVTPPLASSDPRASSDGARVAASAPVSKEPSPEAPASSDAGRRGRSITEVPTKVPAHAMRAGPDVTPPRIDWFTPTPGAWVVGLVGVPEVKIGFDEPMALPIPAGAITAWTVAGGAVTGFTTSYDPATDVLTVVFASPIRDDRLTIVVDFTLTDLTGNELDGEIADPLSAVLPSGDGVRGGQAVFRINILQGDANRDGVVDLADATLVRDALGLCSTSPNFDPRTDLNLDGCVNALDAAIYLLAEGRTLPATDGVRPIVTEITDPVTPVLSDFGVIRIRYDEQLRPERYMLRSCFVVDGSRTIRLPLFISPSGFGNSANCVFDPPLEQCNNYTVNISNGLADFSGELLATPSTPPVLSGLVPPPAPVLDAHATMVTTTSVTTTGRAPGAQSVEVSVPALPLTDPMRLFTIPVTNNAFTADITLAPDSGNAIFFTALSTCSGVRSPPVMTTVTHDTQPPEIFIDFPLDSAQITTATTDVAGRVGDMLSGFMGLTVTVNGAPAIVDVGIGSNGTFFAQDVPLDPIGQVTTITAVATDALGNTVSKQITVTRVAIPTATAQMVALPPANPADRTGSVLTALPTPIVVQMTDTDGTPFVNKVVTFKVTRSDGRLGASAADITPITDPDDPNFNPDPGVMMYQVRTDANGEARAYWRMGHDAGCGNNRVEATSTSVEGTVAFCASASAAPASQLNIGMGNNQRAEAGGPAPEPLSVWVSDGQNGKCEVQVTFTVTQGGGTVTGNTSLLQCSDADQVFPPTVTSGQSVTVYTDRTGHAEVSFTLGPDQGNNVVEATVASNLSLQPARFVTFGVLRDEATPTNFIGVVLNNAGQPIGGATCTLTVGAQTFTAAPTDTMGRFTFDRDAMGMPQAILSGAARLRVDGSPATTVNGQPVELGVYPSLAFESVIIPNAVNSLATPVLLPPLEVDAGVPYDGTADITLTLADVDGLEMLVRAGTTVTKRDGTVVNPGNPITLMLSQVHADRIPMPIPDGASPPFAWTLQPSLTTFNPPIEITYPNMSGLPAGSIAYFLSFNHATSRFEIVASGHVTDDGSQIISDPGAGLTVAGWGCNCPPYSVTGDCEFDPCKDDPSGCCQDRCCQNPNDPCCNNPNPCCNMNDPCCHNPDRCCNPDNPCCGSDDPCCNPNDPCCGDPNRCCNPDSPCCGSPDPCCNPNDPCCGSDDPCCNDDNPCCMAAASAVASGLVSTDESVATNSIMAGAPCCGEGANDPCCNNIDPCCQCNEAGLLCCGDHCCEIACCGNGCRLANQVCCDGVPCAPENCCGNGVCCSDVCEKCKINGTLSGGSIAVSQDPVCVGETITFTVSGVVDDGGEKQVDCTGRMTLPAVTPICEWTVTKPDGIVKGSTSGPTCEVTIRTTAPGPHRIDFTIKAERECPPPAITIGPKTAEAIDTQLNIISLAPPGTFILGTDLVINYEVTPMTGMGFDQVDLEIKNALGTLVFGFQGLPGSPGTHSVTWPKGKWNQSPFAGAFANPKNSPYEVKLIGVTTVCPDRVATDSVATKLELEADIKDDLPTGATAMRSAGLEDMLDTLKIVMKLGPSETVFSGTGITVTGLNPDNKHIKVDAPGLNTLADGLYDVLFRDLRDEIGNFADDDGNPTNGIQPIKFSLELR